MRRIGALPDKTKITGCGGRDYVIRVILVTPTEMQQLMTEDHDADDSHARGRRGKEPGYLKLRRLHKKRQAFSATNCQVIGFWDDSVHAIYIDSSLSRRRRLDVYWHELLHAINDLWAFDKGGL